jgi:DNA (cytosine-5)-methyltransferase 1
MTFGSLFAGIGGFDLGFERAGMTCEWQVEIDDYANRVLEKHWPNVRRWRDVRTFPPKPVEQWKVDVICGGFPCQDISYAGRGSGLEGARSGLFFEAVRVARQLRPRYVLLENVAALLTRGLDRVHGELAQIGYCSESHCLPAASFGAPHIRDRVFVLAYAIGDGSHSWWAECERQQRSAAPIDASGNVANAQDANGWKDSGVETSSRPSHGQQPRRPIGRTPTRYDWWATEPDMGRVADGVPNRVDRLRGLGNAVVPQVAEWIGRMILTPPAETAK